jgi:hypothetical protein
MSLAEAKPIAKTKPGTKVNLVPYFEIKSDLSTDEIIAQLDEYEIEVTIINQ